MKRNLANLANFDGNLANSGEFWRKFGGNFANFGLWQVNLGYFG